MDYHSFHEMAIRMLTELSDFVPDRVCESIVKTLSANTLTEKERAFQRFSTFWKLTTDSKYLIQYDITKVGLFKMLDFLDDDNPLIRHSAKSWLQDSIMNFHKILDTLFESLLSSTNWYSSDSGQFFYSNYYNIKEVAECFKRFKNILIAVSDLFMKYVTEVDVENRRVLELAQKLEDKDWLAKGKNFTYIKLLIITCLRYIQGQALDGIKSTFIDENQSVNASACEFLSFLFKHIDNRELNVEATVYISHPLLITQAHALKNSDYVLQIQL